MGTQETQEHESIYLQWVMEGEKQGLIVQTTGIVEDDDMKFYELSDGSRVNTELVGDRKFIMQISDPDNPYTFEKIVHPPAPMIEMEGSDKEKYYAPNEALSYKERMGWTEIKLIPPKRKTILPTPKLSSGTSSKVIENTPVKSASNEDSVISMLKNVKLEQKALDINISLNMIPKDFFNMTSKYVEGSEEKMIKFLVDSIINELSFRDNLEKAVLEYYNIEDVVKKTENA